MRRQRSYTDEQRTAALLALDANGGNVKVTAAELGLPRKTLEQWAKGIAVPHVAKTRHVTRLPLADRLEELAHQLIDCIPSKLDEAPLREVAAALNVAAEKMRLLREQATTIERYEHLSDAERVAGLAALYDRLAEGGVRPAPGDDRPAVH